MLEIVVRRGGTEPERRLIGCASLLGCDSRFRVQPPEIRAGIPDAHQIDPTQVAASLQDGIVTVVAKKAPVVRAKSVASGARPPLRPLYYGEASDEV